jgi:L,D-peptidoglycan transpeptidase YkuD (ErfK/YbiS/YcfS/YnhG family)
MNFVAHADGFVEADGQRLRCALGPAGVVPAEAKREGDGAAPAGVWPLRRVLYRADRGPPPETALPVAVIELDDGWCDDPASPAYNYPVKLPFSARAEEMWREDALYDIVVVLGHNDGPPVPNMGSCIFMHVAREGYAATQGCVALAREDLEALLKLAGPGSTLEIRP